MLQLVKQIFSLGKYCYIKKSLFCFFIVLLMIQQNNVNKMILEEYLKYKKLYKNYILRLHLNKLGDPFCLHDSNLKNPSCNVQIFMDQQKNLKQFSKNRSLPDKPCFFLGESNYIESIFNCFFTPIQTKRQKYLLNHEQGRFIYALLNLGLAAASIIIRVKAVVNKASHNSNQDELVAFIQRYTCK